MNDSPSQPLFSQLEIKIVDSMNAIEMSSYEQLRSIQTHDTPFLSYAYLSAMHDSLCASLETGFQFQLLTVWSDQKLVAACPFYIKNHSMGEYVFDQSWANAYHQNGLEYYPKITVAPPFTPVPGARLLVQHDSLRAVLLKALEAFAKQNKLSSIHILFASDADLAAAQEAGWLLRHGVQFHWQNPHPKYVDFTDFLSQLNQVKRKKIKQEQLKVKNAGVVFRHCQGTDISSQDWAFFYQCYAQTYYEHGRPPYLNIEFFQQIASTMPGHWLLFIAEKNGQAIASSLIGLQTSQQLINGQFSEHKTAYGRYWGALERVDCLHFDACYYQPIQWCINNGYDTFEGGAQGEHKLARALLPEPMASAHWVANPTFKNAIHDFLNRESAMIENYQEQLASHSPFKKISN
jgi:predicted N-acyltransferase